MKAFLSKKYKGKIADRLIRQMDFSVPLEFNKYCDMLEKIMNKQPDKLKKMAFESFNFNEDNTVCELDLYALMKTYE